MAIWTRRDATRSSGLVHHSDRGGQYLAIRYTARLEEAGIVPSVGSKGNSYDNALAETVNGLYKAELIRRRGPWRTVDAVAVATAAWVAWWNAQRLHGALGHVPPAEYEAAHQPAAARPWRNDGGTFGNEFVERCRTRTSPRLGPPVGRLAGPGAPRYSYRGRRSDPRGRPPRGTPQARLSAQAPSGESPTKPRAVQHCSRVSSPAGSVPVRR